MQLVLLWWCWRTERIAPTCYNLSDYAKWRKLIECSCLQFRFFFGFCFFLPRFFFFFGWMNPSERIHMKMIIIKMLAESPFIYTREHYTFPYIPHKHWAYGRQMNCTNCTHRIQTHEKSTTEHTPKHNERTLFSSHPLTHQTQHAHSHPHTHTQPPAAAQWNGRWSLPHNLIRFHYFMQLLTKKKKHILLELPTLYLLFNTIKIKITK